MRGLVHAHFEEADRFALRVRKRNHAVQPDAVDVDDLADVRLAGGRHLGIDGLAVLVVVGIEDAAQAVVVGQRRQLVAKHLVDARIRPRIDLAFPGDRLLQLLQNGLVVRVHVVLHVPDAVHGFDIHRHAPDFQIAPQIVPGLLLQPAVHVVEDHVGRDAHRRAQHRGHQQHLLGQAPPVGRGVADGQGDQRDRGARQQRELQPDGRAPQPERRVGLRAIGHADGRGLAEAELHRLAVVRQREKPVFRLETLALEKRVLVPVPSGDLPVEHRFGAVVPRQPHDGVAAQIGKEQLPVQIMEIRRDGVHLVGQVAPVVALRGRPAGRRRVDFRGGRGIGQFAAVGGHRRVDHAGRVAGKRRGGLAPHGARGGIDQKGVDAIGAHEAEPQAFGRPLEGADQPGVVGVVFRSVRERIEHRLGPPLRGKTHHGLAVDRQRGGVDVGAGDVQGPGGIERELVGEEKALGGIVAGRNQIGQRAIGPHPRDALVGVEHDRERTVGRANRLGQLVERHRVGEGEGFGDAVALDEQEQAQREHQHGKGEKGDARTSHGIPGVAIV